MASYIPVTLVGDTLGQRHCFLNALVNKAFKENVSFDSLQNLPERTSIDRVFKIDLANKIKNVNFIIENLKETDMLYVSRALKCHWLLDKEYQHIICPLYLETELYPYMTTIAVKKMQHWIILNLKDNYRNEEFYSYYESRDRDTSLKFLLHCSVDFVLKTIVKDKVFENLSPKYLKILCEKCPEIAKIYFDTLEDNPLILSDYISNEEVYYNKLKFLLKINSNMFLDIIEKYYNRQRFSRFNSVATKYIMKHRRDRFFKKPELYAAWLLDMKALGICLTSEEIKDVIVRLARAKYLDWNFSYKTVEPLIKCLPTEERASFKKDLFVDKKFIDDISEWPYPPPSAPEEKNHETHIFSDVTEEFSIVSPQFDMINCCADGGGFRMCLKRACIIKPKTLLDKLFEQYRFASFEHTLLELRKRLLTESSQQNRQYMILVLVSKSGGRSESIDKLLQLLVKSHSNEPSTVRAAVIRSLIKRSSAWRLPEETWKLLLELARGLGLDGTPSKVPCHEGLHAVVIRNMLSGTDINPLVLKAFYENFSSLRDYPLSSSERRQVSEALCVLLLQSANTEPTTALERLQQLFETLNDYRIQPSQCPGLVVAVSKAALRDPKATSPILHDLFNARVGRRELILENFKIIQTNASYLNMLKHDAKVLYDTTHFKQLLTCNNLRHDSYLRSLDLYFSEDSGLAELHLEAIKRELFTETPNLRLAKAACRLAGDKLWALIETVDKSPEIAQKRLAATMRACSHIARPPLDVNAIGWDAIGMKAVANKIIVCNEISVKQHIQELLNKKRGLRLAGALTLRLSVEEICENILKIGSFRPSVAVNVALRYFHQNREKSDPKIWLTVKSFLSRINLRKGKSSRLREALIQLDSIPVNIKVDYGITVYKVFKKNDDSKSLYILNTLETSLHEVDDEIIEDILSKGIKDDTCDIFLNGEIYVRFLAKFLLLGKNEIDQKARFERVCKPFLKHIEEPLKTTSVSVPQYQKEALLNGFLRGLRFNTVFFSSDYAPCLPTFQWITSWMHETLPLEQYLWAYVHIHMTMIYYKSIKQSIKHNPDIFAKEFTKNNEGVEIVGTVFGKYLCREIDELLQKQFNSIIKLYQKDVLSYFRNLPGGSSYEKFVTAIVKGFLEGNNNGNAQILAEYLYYKDIRNFNKKCSEEILDLLKSVDSKEMQYFLAADALV